MAATATISPAAELDLNEMLSPAQAAKELGVGVLSTSTVLHRARDGQIPAVRVGNRFKIRRGDLHLLIKPVTPGDNKLDVLVKNIVDNFPKLNTEQKAELGRLLAPAA